MAVEKGSLEYRVLVELAGQARPMTARELFDVLDSRCTPEDLHLALYDLGDRVKHGYVQKQGWLTDFDKPTYAISWEGEEALRRADTEDTRRMRAVPAQLSLWQRLRRKGHR